MAQFLEGAIGFNGIPELIAAALEAHRPDGAAELAAIEQADRWAREWSRRRLALSGA